MRNLVRPHCDIWSMASAGRGVRTSGTDGSKSKESIRDTEGTGGVVQSGEVVGVDSRGGGDNEEGEHSGGTGGEASDSVKVSGADGGGQRTLKLADYICGRRQERGNMTRGSGDGKGEWGHKVSG